jgi:hypothetical protein
VPGLRLAVRLECGRRAREVALEVRVDGLRAVAEHDALVVIEVDAQRDRVLDGLDREREPRRRVLAADEDRVAARAEIEIGRAVARVAKRRRVALHGDAPADGRLPTAQDLHLDGALARTEVEDQLRDQAALHADALLSGSVR